MNYKSNTKKHESSNNLDDSDEDVKLKKYSPSQKPPKKREYRKDDNESDNDSGSDSSKNTHTSPLTQQSTTILDYYKILNVPPTAKKREIQKAYNTEILRHHPAKAQIKIMKKYKGKEYKNISEKKLKKMINDEIDESKEYYNLLNKAHTKLMTSRKEYDNDLKMYNDQESNHSSMKQQSSDFFKTLHKNETEDTAEFKKQWKELNKQHNITDDKKSVSRENYAFEPKKLAQMIASKQIERDKQEKTFVPKKIKGLTSGLSFDNKAFNKEFHRRNKKSNKTKAIMEVANKMPTPWNSSSSEGMFTGITSKPLIYEEEGESTEFGKVDFSENTEDKSDESGSSGSDEYEDAYDTHNKNKGKTYQLTIDQKIAERKRDDANFKARSHKDFSTEILYEDSSSKAIEGLLPEYNEDDFAQNTSTSKSYKKLIAQRQMDDVNLFGSSPAKVSQKKHKQTLRSPSDRLNDVNFKDNTANIRSTQDFHNINNMMNKMAEKSLQRHSGNDPEDAELAIKQGKLTRKKHN